MSGPIDDLRRLFAISPRRRRRLVVAAFQLCALSYRLRRSGYPRTRGDLEGRLPAPEATLPLDPELFARAEDDGWAVRACASRLPVGTCLERSLTLWWMLRRQGIPSEIHFGGRLEDDVLEAHAWLEVDGVALTDVDEPRDSFRELRTGPHRS